jgi:hypothetical protein
MKKILPLLEIAVHFDAIVQLHRRIKAVRSTSEIRLILGNKGILPAYLFPAQTSRTRSTVQGQLQQSPNIHFSTTHPSEKAYASQSLFLHVSNKVH